MSDTVRAYWYRIATAVVPILTAYGVVGDREAAIWLGLAAAVFSTSLATVHTSTKENN
jgi:hypothetical protein